MMTDKTKALMRVQTYGFALDEAILFLDNHPENPDAMEYYKKVQKEYDNAVEMYTSRFGPLQAKQVRTHSGWSWVEGCMPWESECNVEL